MQLRLPGTAVKGASSGVLALSCVGRWCLAGGGYSGLKYHSFALITTESGGRWARATQVRLPAAAVQAAITSVDCTAVRSCIAVGSYDGFDGSATFSVTESAGHWGRPQIIAPPIGGGNPRLGGVSCFAPGSCEAVGTFQKGQDYQAVTATETRGVWQHERVLLLPQNGYVGQLNSISCPARGYCVAVGDYDFNTADFGVMTAVESHGIWRRAHAIRLPVGAEPGDFSPDLSSVSCTGVGACTAVGSYQNGAGRQVPMVAVESGGRWAQARAINARPPNGSRQRDATFGAISCFATGSCLAIGSYHTTSRRPETMFVTLAPGQKPTASELALPPNGKAGGQFNFHFLFYNAVDCTSAAFCAAVGTYKPASGQFQAWTATTP